VVGHPVRPASAAYSPTSGIVPISSECLSLGLTATAKSGHSRSDANHGTATFSWRGRETLPLRRAACPPSCVRRSARMLGDCTVRVVSSKGDAFAAPRSRLLSLAGLYRLFCAGRNVNAGDCLGLLQYLLELISFDQLDRSSISQCPSASNCNRKRRGCDVVWAFQDD
jgi:hypothetical protein